MKKYIRTKDGIYKVLKKPKGNYAFEKTDVVIGFLNDAKHTPIIAEKDDIIKQADTIEELCDKYYGVDENGEIVRVHNWSKDAYPPEPHEWAVDGFCTKEDITINELKNRFPKGIFGAIVWFDDNDNLHIDIVAKMNEKGELELL